MADLRRILAIAFAAALLLAAANLSLGAGDVNAKALATILIWHGAVMLFWAVLERREGFEDLLNPFLIIYLMSMVHFVGPSFYNALVLQLPTTADSYLAAHHIIGVFMLSVACGSLLLSHARARRGESRPSPLVTDGLLLPFVVAYAFVALLCAAYFVREAGGIAAHLAGLGLRMALFEGKGVLLSLMTLGAPAVILMYVYAIRRGGVFALLGVGVVFLIAVATGVMTGSRGSLLAFGLALLIVRHYARKPISLIGGAAGLVLVCTFLVGYIALVRQPSLGKELAQLESPAAFAEAIVITLYGKGTFKELNSVARVREKVPRQVSHTGGATFAAAATFPIPRALWPGKWQGGSEVFTRQVRPEIWAQGRGDRVTFVGELFMNFGMAGVIAGGLAFGLLLQLVYGSFPGLGSPPLQAALYAVFIVSCVSLFRGDFAISVFQFLRFFLPVALVYALARWQTGVIERSGKPGFGPAAAT